MLSISSAVRFFSQEQSQMKPGKLTNYIYVTRILCHLIAVCKHFYSNGKNNV